MREILFRGKKKDSGDWVCGDLIKLHEEAPYWYILPEGISSEMYEDEPYHFRQNDVMCSVALAKIIPETVGQFTGLTDKNGKKIFEGDIVKLYLRDDVTIVGDIRYSEEDCRFKFWEDFEYPYGFDITTPFEVIGNIHDNPELLGE